MMGVLLILFYDELGVWYVCSVTFTIYNFVYLLSTRHVGNFYFLLVLYRPTLSFCFINIISPSLRHLFYGAC